ncbi:MAG: cation acetate symporter [Egibacteraceae bacterium]
MTAEGVLLIVAMVVTLLFAALVRPRRASTLDFYLAGQRIGVVTNAFAICGDYFSAASFLGVAAAVYVSGLDGVWYATGFAAGFVPVLLFVAAPLRRFGEFSIPDFLGRRLESERVRLLAVAVVELIILSYLVPQAVGSGIVWDLLVGQGMFGLDAYVTGVLVSTFGIALAVVFGGMRGTTWTQAVQFLFMLMLLGWLAGSAVVGGFRYATAVERLGDEPLRTSTLTPEGWRLEPVQNQLDAEAPARFDRPGARYDRISLFALVVTLVMGTAGLPHVMNRYFTSPTGRAARMTTVWVLGAAGMFYALAVMLGTAARAIIPRAPSVGWLRALTVDGVLQVPEHALLVLGRLYGGRTGLTLLAIGAFIAVVSTIAGLLLAAAASWGHDIYERHLRPGATQRQAVRAGRLAVLVVAAISAAIALPLEPVVLSARFPSIVASMVTWAFALAGSALTPVFVLTIWWRGMTATGALAGMLTGALVAVGAFLAGLAGAGGILLFPTVFAAPLSALATVLVSQRGAPPERVEAHWMRLHGTAADRQAERLAELTIRGVDGR